jgi:branched-chain amino acid aminotransferase
MAIEARKIWLDGELVPWRDASVHVLSQSIQRGSLVFDVMSVHPMDAGPAIFGLREHCERFLSSARLNQMELAIDLDELLAGVAAAVEANPGCDLVKLSAYHAGVALDVLPVDPRASVAIAAFSPADVDPDEGTFRPSTARLQVADTRKLPASVLSPQVKIAAGYTAAAVAKQKARAEGFHDILLLDERGNLAESSTQSFFVVAQEILRTAPLEIVLSGITRRAVIELARDEGVEVKVESLPRRLIESADEAFLTGTTTNIWPVERIDAAELPHPVPGPISERLMERFERMLSGEDAVFSPKWMQKV